jgi:hypothetical protein
VLLVEAEGETRVFHGVFMVEDEDEDEERANPKPKGGGAW